MLAGPCRVPRWADAHESTGGTAPWIAHLVLEKDGEVISIARVKDPMGGDWAADGRILVADDEGSKPAWVDEAGGALRRIPIADSVGRQWRYPRLLPGDDWAIHTDWDGALAISSVTSGREYGVTTDGVTRRDSTDVSKLVFGTNPVYVESGHIRHFRRRGARRCHSTGSGAYWALLRRC
jgi:hypothetical protein